MFPDLQIGLQAEEAIKAARSHPVSASAYPQWKEHANRDIIEDFKSGHGLVDLSINNSEVYMESQESPLQTNSSQISVSSPRVINGGAVNGSLNGDGLPSRPYPSLVEERLDSISDNMSYMSLEVNTTGTGSVRVC
jgi:coatomer subunit beta'